MCGDKGQGKESQGLGVSLPAESEDGELLLWSLVMVTSWKLPAGKQIWVGS